MPNHPSPPQDALAALQSAVRSLESRGRVTRVAGVKSEVQRHMPNFSERSLGYPSFGAFVEAAAGAGAVRVFKDDEDWTRVASLNRPAAPDHPTERLRPDIWRAFTQWGGSEIRVWDRATSRAVRLPATPPTREHPEHLALREALSRSDGQVIAIPAIDMQAQQGWMEEIANGLGDHPLARPLQAALTDSKPFRAFSATLRADDSLKRAFNRLRTRHVLEAVRAWAAEHDVDLDALDHDAPPPLSFSARADASPADASAKLRAALHRAVDEMAIEDLRRLAVPAGYLIDALL